MYKNSVVPQKSSAFPVYSILILLFVSAMSGCAFKVKLVGEYDQIVDKSVTELQQSTVTFFTKMKAASNADRTYELNKDFYAEAEGKISTLIVRSEVIEEGLKKNPLTKNFKDLKLQYLELSTEHKKNPSARYFESAEKAFNQSFRAILEHLLYLKWNQTQPEPADK
jgi:hypothetical protein